MNQNKKSHYLSKTRDEIVKLYDEVRSLVKNMIVQPSLIITPAEIKTIVVFLDESLVKSEKFKDIIRRLKDKADKIIGLYVPEEEDIISKLKELGDDKKEILDSLREFEAKKEVRILSVLDELMRKEKISVDIEIKHKPRLDTLTEICDREKPDLIIMSRGYSKDRYDIDIKHLIYELMNKLKCPILLI